MPDGTASLRQGMRIEATLALLLALAIPWIPCSRAPPWRPLGSPAVVGSRHRVPLSVEGADVRVFRLVMERDAGVVVDDFGVPGARVWDQEPWRLTPLSEEMGRRGPDMLAFACGTNESASARVSLPEVQRRTEQALARMGRLAGRGVGFMEREGAVVSNRRVSRFRGVLAFDPGRNSAAMATVTGDECGLGLERAARSYLNLLAAFRLLDCRGQAIRWSSAKRFSAAGHQRTSRVHAHPHAPSHGCAQPHARPPELRLRGMVFVAGGPEASLYVQAEGVRLAAMGSYEHHFFESDGHHAFWDLPNIIAFSRR